VTIAAGRDHVLFDGDCGVCTWWADTLRRWDRAGRFVVEPYQGFTADDLARHGLTLEQAAAALTVITREGRVERGAFAINAVLWRLRGAGRALVVLLYALPILLLLELALYRLVAEHRQRISRWMGLKGCLVKPS